MAIRTPYYIGSCNGLLPDGTNLLTEPMFDSSVAFTWEQFHWSAQALLCLTSLKMILLKLLQHLPGPNELILVPDM